jgi:hypothetical protein
MFQAIRMRTPIKLAAEKMMEADISLQESEEALRLDRVEALRAKFAKASGAKAASKEKGVSWSTPEEEACWSGGTKQGINPKANAAVDGRPQQKRGSKYRKSSKTIPSIWALPWPSSPPRWTPPSLCLSWKVQGHNP